VMVILVFRTSKKILTAEVAENLRKVR
jgi:hypothetical protein